MLVRQSTSVPNTSKNSALGATGMIPSSRNELRSAGLRSRRLHAFGLEDCGRGRTRQGADQLLRRGTLLGIGAKPRRIDGVVLDLRRQRPDQRDALHRQDLADLMHAELGLTVGDVLGD